MLAIRFLTKDEFDTRVNSMIEKNKKVTLFYDEETLLFPSFWVIKHNVGKDSYKLMELEMFKRKHELNKTLYEQLELNSYFSKKANMLALSNKVVQFYVETNVSPFIRHIEFGTAKVKCPVNDFNGKFLYFRLNTDFAMKEEMYGRTKLKPQHIIKIL